MNVLLVLPSLKETGPIIVAKNLMDYSNNKKIKYTVLSLRANPKNLIQWYEEKGIDVKEVGIKNIPSIKCISKFKKKVDEINPDIIHAHVFWPTILTSFLKKYKKICTIHNNPIEDYTYEYGFVIGYIMTKIFLKSINKYDTVVPISRFVERNINIENSEKVRVIYNGVEDRLEKFENNQKNDSENKIRIVTVSVLNKRKNVRKILEIVEGLKIKGHNVLCEIIGEGEELSNLMKIVEQKNIQNEVKFLGNISRECVFRKMSESDFFLFTSLSEGFGLVVVEAMMMKKVVLVNDIPVMNELINNGVDGFIFDKNKDFVLKIEEMIDNKSYNFSHQARLTYLEKFTVNKMVDDYELLFNKIFSNK